MSLARARRKFLFAKKKRLDKKQEWNLTFDQWYNLWLSVGIDKNLTEEYRRGDSLCMITKDNSKPWQIDNVELVTFKEMSRCGYIKRPKIRPDLWMYKDPKVHKKHLPFLRARAQAHFRKEQWDLTMDDWCEIWTDEAWANRGRGSNQTALTRIDLNQGWTRDNVELLTRSQQLKRHPNKLRSRKVTGKLNIS